MATLRNLLLDYGLFVWLLVCSAWGHYAFAEFFRGNSDTITVMVRDRQVGQTRIAIQVVAARPKPKLELEEIVKEIKPKELPKPQELLIAKAELPLEKIVTAEIPSPTAPPVYVPPPPPPLEKIEPEEKPPEEKPPEPRKRKPSEAKPQTEPPIESLSDVTLAQEAMQGADREALATAYPDPIYPPGLWRRGIEGRGEVYLTIDEEGRPVNVRIGVSSGYAEMDQSALDTFRTKWKFEPKLVRGRPVAHEVSVPFSFGFTKKPAR
jgi:protein TonB